MSFIKPNKWLRFFLIVILSINIAACGGGSGSDSNPSSGTNTSTDSGTDTASQGNANTAVASRDLQQLVISPFIDTVSKGGQVSFTSTGIYSDQSSEDLTAQVTWTIDDESLASIDSTGQLTPVKAGQVTITAAAQGVQTQRSLIITEVTLDSLQIIPQQANIANGLQQQFQAVGLFSDGSSMDLSTQVSWASSATQVVEMSSSSAIGKAVGNASISATYDGKTAVASIIVNSAILQGLEVEVAHSSLQVALQSELNAVGFYSDNTSHDVTSQVTWSVDDGQIAIIDSTISRIEALAVGSTVIRAELAGFQAQAALTVNDAVLSKIEISPATTSVAAGLQQQMTATGLFSNQTSQDLTGQVTWLSSDTTVANVDNRAEAKGQVSAMHKGSVTISAHYQEVTGSTELTVNDAELVSIEVAPANAKLANGLQQQFVATAFYTDGSNNDVTDQVSWSSEHQNAALVGGQTAGLFQANTIGSTLVVASLNNIQGFTSLEITNATLDSLTIAPQSSKQALGTTQQLTAFAHYSDGSSSDVSNQVSWSSSNTGIAQVSNSAEHHGALTAVSTGNTEITAQLESVQAAASIEVTAAVLTEIQLTSSTEPFYVNQQRYVDALGIYSDGSHQVLNDQVFWASTQGSVIVVSNAQNAQGLMTAVSAGQALVSATLAGITSNSLTFDVIDEPDYPASISLSAAPNVILNDGADSTTLLATIRPLQVNGVIADGTAVNFIILENGVTRNQAATTTGGVASLNLTSIETGFIQVTAELVADTDINATIPIYSTDNFARILLIGRSFQVAMSSDNSTYLAGSQFVLFMRNLSNRDFNILGFLARNGGVDFYDSPVTDAAYLSGGVLEGGEYTVMGYQLDSDTVDNTISTGYVLSDSASNKVFGFTVDYMAP